MTIPHPDPAGALHLPLLHRTRERLRCFSDSVIGPPRLVVRIGGGWKEWLSGSELDDFPRQAPPSLSGAPETRTGGPGQKLSAAGAEAAQIVDDDVTPGRDPRDWTAALAGYPAPGLAERQLTGLAIGVSPNRLPQLETGNQLSRRPSAMH